MPSARSSPSDPVGSAGMSWESAASPSFMMAPLPNCFSIWLTARSIARSRFTSMAMTRPPPNTRWQPLYLARLPVSSGRHGYFQGSTAAEREPLEGFVHSARGAKVAPVEDDLAAHPAAELEPLGRLEPSGEALQALRRTHPPERDVGGEGARLRRKAERRE